MIERTLSAVLQELAPKYRKLVLLSGPRQVGKTTLAREVGERLGGAQYFNWDILDDRKRLARHPYFFDQAPERPQRVVVLDEIHKLGRWKSYLKGAYDKYRDEYLFLVTGSGRLDLYRKGGDSLMGRTLPVPLLPLSLGELGGRLPTFVELRERLAGDPPGPGAAAGSLEALLALGGFPEPFARQEATFYNLWRQERGTQLVREDIRDATRIRELASLELLTQMIPDRVGGPLSANALREDLGVAFETVRDWLEVLERFYYLFRLPPFTGNLTRSLRKEAKAYLLDWAAVEEPGPRFENLVAVHLLKAARVWRALGQGDLEFRYVRDRERREVDFVLCLRRKPLLLVEAKLSETEPDPSLLYFQAKLGVELAVQVVARPGFARRFKLGGRRQWVLSADRFLPLLP